MQDKTGSGKHKMATSEMELVICQLLDEIETKFRRTFLRSSIWMGLVQILFNQTGSGKIQYGGLQNENTYISASRWDRNELCCRSREALRAFNNWSCLASNSSICSCLCWQPSLTACSCLQMLINDIDWTIKVVVLFHLCSTINHLHSTLLFVFTSFRYHVIF